MNLLACDVPSNQPNSNRDLEKLSSTCVDSLTALHKLFQLFPASMESQGSTYMANIRFASYSRMLAMYIKPADSIEARKELKHCLLLLQAEAPCPRIPVGRCELHKNDV